MKFRILVIDDEKNIREGLQMALEDDGYEVLTAEDGTVGLQKALTEVVDLVITDLRMPGGYCADRARYRGNSGRSNADGGL